MQVLLQHTSKIGTNGKLLIKLSRKTNSSSYSNKKLVFKTGKENLFLIEIKVNSPNPNPDRKFTLAVRRDGCEEYKGQHKLSQIGLNMDDLITLRDSLNDMINAEYQ